MVTEIQIDHLFFDCAFARTVWGKLLNWLQFKHVRIQWLEESCWILQNTRWENPRSRVLKATVAKTIFFVWQSRNGEGHGEGDEWIEICRRIVVRCAYKNRYILKADNRLQL